MMKRRHWVVRDATTDDFDELIPYAREAHKRSPFGETVMDESHMKRVFACSISFEGGFAKVVEHDGKIVGGMVAAIGINHWGVRAATDYFMFSERDTHKLLRSFIRWAKERGAQFVQVTDLSGNERYHRLIRRIGLDQTSINFSGVI